MNEFFSLHNIITENSLCLSPTVHFAHTRVFEVSNIQTISTVSIWYNSTSTNFNECTQMCPELLPQLSLSLYKLDYLPKSHFQKQHVRFKLQTLATHGSVNHLRNLTVHNGYPGNELLFITHASGFFMLCWLYILIIFVMKTNLMQ
jgi:hypothetical protein